MKRILNLSLVAGWLSITLLLLPALAAVWLVPGFATQDGPAHLYNAWILFCSFAEDSPYRLFYEVRWELLPNWAGHLSLVGLLGLVSPWVADRILLTATLLGFALSISWLRFRVRGASEELGPAALSALISLNYLWLLGFTSFLLGSCLFSITLAFWWSVRQRLNWTDMAGLGALLVVGYFAHLVSLGLTVLGILLLAIVAPSEGSAASPWSLRWKRVSRSMVSAVPAFLLMGNYRRMSRLAGPMSPEWSNLADPFSPTSWASRLGWVDPLTIAAKGLIPFLNQRSVVFGVLAPVVCLALAAMAWWAGRWWPRKGDSACLQWGGDRDHNAADCSGLSDLQINGGPRATTGKAEMLPWSLLAGILLAGGVLGPDSLGPAHGEFLPQRLVLLGLVAAVPVVELDPRLFLHRASVGLLLVALAIQTLILWDYATYSERTAGQFWMAREQLGERQRIATLLVRIKSHFRANPLLHADNWLGVETGNIVWNNYETRHYYFPVQFRGGIARPQSRDLERLAIMDAPEQDPHRLRLWNRLLAEHTGDIDWVVVWRDEPDFAAVTQRYFEVASRHGELTLYRRRGDDPGSG
jgi:hypothetical protein